MQTAGTAALVTGAGSGLGEATARTLASAGATVFVLDLDADAAGRVAAEIGGTALVVDVGDTDAVTRAIDAIDTERVPRIVVNCAGIGLAARVLPRSGERDHSYFLKLGTRKYLVISIAMVAANLHIDERGLIESARIAVGACSAVATRLDALEQYLRGTKSETIGDTVMQFAGSMPLTPIDDIRASKAYRESAAKVLVARTLTACANKHAHDGRTR